MRREAARAGPHLHDALLKFRQHALFLQAAEGVRGRGAGGEGAVGGLRGVASVDGRFGADEIVWVQGNGGGGEREE